uniref:Uncharacterized protein n=1 Tax=viral metagenome TaxID=1070528 RepID=A0A6C0ECX7_9ZZZZ
MLFKLIIEANKKILCIFLFADTKITKIQNIGYIAKLDANKKEILNVYLDRKSACKLNNYKSLASLDEPVKQLIKKAMLFLLIIEEKIKIKDFYF